MRECRPGNQAVSAAEIPSDEKGLLRKELETWSGDVHRVIGDTSGDVHLSFTSSFFRWEVPRVPFLHRQTGNFASYMRYIALAKLRWARVVGIGNKIDVDESDVLEYYATDPETKAIFVYLESMKNPKRFFEIARETARCKPIIMLKGGSTEGGSHAAGAHTAAMASDDRIIDGALKQAGIVRIYQYSHLILAAKALSVMPLPRGNRVSFLAPSGAMLVNLTDMCQKYWSLEVPTLEESSRRRLQEISPPYIRMRNPVDIWPSAIVHGIEFAYREGMEAVLKDSHVDAVVPILMITDETGVPDLQFIVDLSRRYSEKPIFATFSAEKKHMEIAKEFLETRGVPTFPLIEEPFEVLSILAQWRQFMDRGSRR